jgi:hypothetical protein
MSYYNVSNIMSARSSLYIINKDGVSEGRKITHNLKISAHSELVYAIIQLRDG